jgi:predicted adenine nucleotide alpha hydrolase (AANH) superfamily ATPase
MNKDLASKIDPLVLSEGINKRPKKGIRNRFKDCDEYKLQKTDLFAQSEGVGKSTIILLMSEWVSKKIKKKGSLKAILFVCC